MLDQNVLDGFYGTEAYHSLGALFPKVVLTDGAHYVAEHGGKHGALWLMTDIAAQIPKAVKANPMCEDFQVWHLEVRGDKSAVLRCVPDTDEPPVVEQVIDRTDFDLPELKLYVEPGAVGGKNVWVILLPGEH